MSINVEAKRNGIRRDCVDRKRRFLDDWCKEAGVRTPVGYDFDYSTGMTIYTDKPGYLIGKGGQLVEKYTRRLNEEFGFSSRNNLLKVKFVEIRGGFANHS